MKPSKLYYQFVWRTCRQTPFLGEDSVINALYLYFTTVYGNLGELMIEGWEATLPYEIKVVVSTEDTHRPPSSIFWELSRDSAAYLEKRFPKLKRLPSIWTRNYTVKTKGKV